MPLGSKRPWHWLRRNPYLYIQVYYSVSHALCSLKLCIMVLWVEDKTVCELRLYPVLLKKKYCIWQGLILTVILWCLSFIKTIPLLEGFLFPMCILSLTKLRTQFLSFQCKQPLFYITARHLKKMMAEPCWEFMLV